MSATTKRDGEQRQEDDPGPVEDPLDAGREREGPECGPGKPQIRQGESVLRTRPIRKLSIVVEVVSAHLLQTSKGQRLDSPDEEDSAGDDRQANQVIRHPVVVELPLQDVDDHRGSSRYRNSGDG